MLAKSIPRVQLIAYKHYFVLKEIRGSWVNGWFQVSARNVQDEPKIPCNAKMSLKHQVKRVEESLTSQQWNNLNMKGELTAMNWKTSNMFKFIN